jgi:deferrochelatase/peroxidase EfeB
MPRFTVDDDVDPARTHGDVLLQICGGDRDTVTHALRELLRVVRGRLVLRWMEHGFQGARRDPSPRSSTRNLFAFRDGTANPDTADQELMHRLVWSREGRASLGDRRDLPGDPHDPHAGEL